MLRIRQAMVIGPTPPGTGVIAPATWLAEPKSTSPEMPASVRLMPTSITHAPGFNQSPLTMFGRPTAATTISAPRTTSGKSRVRLWAMVTVQLSPSNSSAIGLPTMFDRPITTADLPEVVRGADIVVAAVGRPEMIKGDWLKPGATVIDVGINRADAGLTGDVDFASASAVAGAITPVPGGVGPMTIACLIRNTLVSAARREGYVMEKWI